MMFVRSKFALGLMVAMGVALAACDAPAKEQTPAQKEEAELNADTVSNGQEGIPGPNDGVVTPEDVPHSDVPPPSREVFTDSECNFEEWVGKPVDEAGIKKLGRPYRLLTPDSMMTMDHNPERVNVVHDKGKVSRVWCG